MLLNEERLTGRIAKARLDAIVAATPENVTYISGFWALPQWIRRGPQVFVLWPKEGTDSAEIITSTSTLDLIADQSPWITRVRRFGSFQVEPIYQEPRDKVTRRHLELRSCPEHEDAVEALISAIREARLDRGRIGFDEAGISTGQVGRLTAQLPRVQWVQASSLLRDVRAVKTAGEVDRLRRAAQTAETSIAAAMAVARDGASEQDLARALHIQTIEEGGEPVLGCIGFGERSAFMNVQPSGRRLRPGDVIRFDVGGRFRHYRADVARTAVFGPVSQEVTRYCRALLTGIEHACTVIRPGMPARRVYEEVVGAVRQAGLPEYRRNHVGHGIGLDGYDAPILSAESTEEIEAGMVLCIETPFYAPGRWGLQIEDTILVQERGVERLMTTDGRLLEVMT